MEPVAVPHRTVATRLHRIIPMLRKPFVQVKKEKLLGPKHTGHCLAHDARLVFAEMCRSDLPIKLVCLALARLHGRIKTAERIPDGSRSQIAEAQTDGGCLSCAH